mmetsp:Transcript_22553/g.52519  ORF Transcript_22553/g.52519 Transcript_22553/m.52519 type:complete len:205 (-) Transcript_22553:116-730(-)
MHGELDGILLVVVVVWSCKELQAFLEDALVLGGLGHHAPHCFHENALRETLQDILEALNLQVAWSFAQVSHVQLEVVLLARYPNLLAIGDHHKCTNVTAICVQRALLAHEKLDNLVGQVAQHLAIRIQVIPLTAGVSHHKGLGMVVPLASPIHVGIPFGSISLTTCGHASHPSWQLVCDHIEASFSGAARNQRLSPSAGADKSI